VDTSPFGVAARKRLRDAALARDKVAEGSMFDRRRPTVHTAKAARRTVTPEPCFDDVFLASAYPMLTQREQQVIVLRYGLMGNLEHTQIEAAVVLGVSQQRVSTIEQWALRKMRAAAESAVA
jgi:DNA-directed RNA polymerase sigma subunit (sigma70/sigma32)